MTIAADGDTWFLVAGGVSYALGRKSYAVSLVCDWVRKHWYKIPVHWQRMIMRDVKGALLRLPPGQFLGMEMDDREWRVLLAWMETRSHEKEAPVPEDRRPDRALPSKRIPTRRPRRVGSPQPVEQVSRHPTLREVKLAHAQALYDLLGNGAAACRILGVTETTLWRWGKRTSWTFPSNLIRGLRISPDHARPVCIGDQRTLKEIEHAHIGRVLESCGSITEAAKALGLTGQTLYRKINALRSKLDAAGKMA